MRLRALLRRARELGAHLHIDMESFDSREAVTDLVLELLSEDEFARRPVGRHRAAGLPARLARSCSTASSTGPRAPRARTRCVVRLVKGAYWDHEIVEARQHGWESPVFEVKADSDRNFEELTRRLLDGAAGRPRRDRLATTCARSPTRSPPTAPWAATTATSSSRSCAASATTCRTRWPRSGLRVRTYCPVGDLVAGMAYLVRRLLENTTNESFLHEQAAGRSLDELLAAP